MKILNIHPYLDTVDNTIKIKFEVLYTGLGPEASFKPIEFNTILRKSAHVLNDEYEELVMEIFHHSDTFIQNEAFKPEEFTNPIPYIVEEGFHLSFAAESDQASPHPVRRFATFHTIKTEYNQYIATYTLSTTPHAALHFILCCTNVVLNMEYDAIYICSSVFENPKAPILDENSLPTDMDMGEAYENEFMVILLQKLFALPTPLKYLYTMDALNKIGGHYIENRTNKKSLMACMQAESRCILLWKPIHDLLFNSLENNKTKLTTLLNFARESIHSNQKAEFNYLMHSMHYLAKKKLYSPCLGQKAHDGGVYKWAYAEWDVLCDAQFRMRPDGHMVIVNMKDNAGYQKNYAPHCKNHAIFINEMQFLGSIIGLEFEPSDFHKEIVFTRICSQRLVEKGLQWSLSYIKSALYTENRASFFTRQFSKSKQLPVELTDTIVQHEDYLDDRFDILTHDTGVL